MLRDNGTVAPVMRSCRVFALFFSVLASYLALQAPAKADLEGVLQVPDGGYLYALDDEDLTDARDGLTIEVWLMVTDPPGDNVVWPLITKDGSYSTLLQGRDLNLPGHELFPGPPMTWRIATTNEGTVGSSGFGFGPDARRWPWGDSVHVAFQIRGDDEGQKSIWFDGKMLGSGVNDFGVGRDNTALFIAGLPPNTKLMPGLLQHGGTYDFRSFPGAIDEVRISRGWRYGGQAAGQPVQGEGPDRNTIALWTFDHGPFQGRYEDESGNGHALFLGGTLAVSARGRLTTTWAQLKRR